MEHLKSIDDIKKHFNKLNVDYALLHPTETGLKKSIFDATQSIVDFLLRRGIHDYHNQNKGQHHKKILATIFIHELGETLIKTSFYRPETKNGDPRLWPAQSNRFSTAGDTLILLELSGQFLIVNISKIGISGLNNALSRLGLSTQLFSEEELNSDNLLNNYGQLNYLLNKVITTGFSQDKELYLDFKDNFLEEICKAASINKEQLIENVFRLSRTALQLKSANPFQELISKNQFWRRSRYRGFPPTTLFLASLSLVAEQMGSDDNFGANNFYDRLFESLQINDVDAQLSIRRNFKKTSKLWEDYNQWLSREDGKYGLPTAYPIVKKWKYVSYGMSQVLVREGDKNHLKKALLSRNLNPELGFDRGDVFDHLDSHLRSTAANKYLSELWKQNHIRAKIIDAALEQITLSSKDELGGSLAKPLKLRIVQRSYPRKSFNLSVVYHDNQMDNKDISIGESSETGAFVKDADLFLSPIQDGLAVLSPPSSIALNRLLFRKVKLFDKENELGDFVFSPRQAMALVEVEPGIYEQTNRPEVFKKHLVLMQRKILDKVKNFLLECADEGFRINENPIGVPDDFVLIQDVFFIRTVSPEEMDGNNDPNYWLRPVPSMSEIDILGGIKLGKNTYHSQSDLQLLIASNEEEVLVSLTDFSDRDTFPEEDVLKYPIKIKSGIGVFKFSEVSYFSDLSNKDIKVDLELEGYKPATISFRSSDNPKNHDFAEVGLVIDEQRPDLFISATEYDRDETVLSGMCIINANEISSASLAHNSPSGITELKQEENNQVGEYLYFEGTDNVPSCLVGGVHIWVFPPMDSSGNYERVGKCRECGEVRHLPKLRNKKISNQSTLRNLKNPSIIHNRYKIIDYETIPNTLNDILDAVFYMQELSWDKFREICSTISNDILFASELLRAFSTVGLIDISLQYMKPKRLHATPPVLFKRCNDYILTGSFSPSLVNSITSITGECSNKVIGEIQGLKLILPTFDIHAVEANSKELLNLTTATGSTLSISDSLAEELIASLPNIGMLYNKLPTASVSLRDIEYFDPVYSKWNSVKEFNMAGAYRQKWPVYNYFIKTPFGDVRLANFEIAKLYAADLNNQRLHEYDKVNLVFRYSAGCELPTLYQRAVFACSGNLPSSSDKLQNFSNVSEQHALILMQKIYGQV